MAKNAKSVTEVATEITEGLATCINLSARIRFLKGFGWSYYGIAQYLTDYEARNHGRDKIVRAQHVRNVCIAPLKKG